MEKKFSYRNVTDNGAVRGVVMTESQVNEKIAQLAIEHPNTVFQKVEIKVYDEVETFWKTGNGRAGGDVKASRRVKRMRPI